MEHTVSDIDALVREEKRLTAVESHNEAWAEGLSAGIEPEIIAEAALETATRGAGTYAERVLELSRANTQAALDFSVALMGAGSLSEAFELLGGQARSQIETFVAQSKELAELGHQVATDAFAPIRDGASKALASVS